MARPPELSRRAQKILQAVVTEYLQSGDAVGSRTVTRRHGIGLSAATVRNVMSDLEDMGLLEQPHTSAGRVPTGSGLRFFIDSLLKVRGLSSQEKERIRLNYSSEEHDFQSVSEVLAQTSRMLSEITRHAGIVLAPTPGRRKLEQLEFRVLRNNKLLCILVTSDGQIENRIVALETAIDVHRLGRIHEYLDQLLGGLTLDEIRDRVRLALADEKNRYDTMVSTALAVGQAVFDKPSRGADVMVSGQANLLATDGAPDEEHFEQMRQLLQALEDKEVMVQLLDQTLQADGVQVFLGAETTLSRLGDSSVIAMPYGPGEQPIGAIAVIGPRRMNYGKVISIVDFTADVVSQLLGDL